MPAVVSILSLHYPPEVTGNAPYTGALASELAARGHTVVAGVGHPHYPEWRIRHGYGQWTREERVDGVTLRRRRHYVPRDPRGVRRLLSELSFGVRLFFGRWGQAEVVIAVSPALFSVALAALRWRLRPRRGGFVVWVQDIYTLGLLETGEGGSRIGRVMKKVESSTLRAADRVVVIHQRFADWVVGELGVPIERVSVVRNWTHLPPSPEVNKDDARRALGWSRDAILAIHTGNMGAKQGLDNIVDAARLAAEQDPRVTFILVGDGHERDSLEERAGGTTGVLFVDPLDEADYRLALAAADVLVVNEKPGVSAMSVPSKLTSYFDANRPILAAVDPDGITASEIGVSGAGVVVPPGDPGALLAGVLALVQDPVRMVQLGESGRVFRQRSLGQDQAINLWEDVVKELSPPASQPSKPRDLPRA